MCGGLTDLVIGTRHLLLQRAVEGAASQHNTAPAPTESVTVLFHTKAARKATGVCGKPGAARLSAYMVVSSTASPTRLQSKTEVRSWLSYSCRHPPPLPPPTTATYKAPELKRTMAFSSAFTAAMSPASTDHHDHQHHQHQDKSGVPPILAHTTEERCMWLSRQRVYGWHRGTTGAKGEGGGITDPSRRQT